MKPKIAIVVAEYNSDITFKMRDIAVKHAKSLGAEISEIITVPGTFEIPYAVKILLKKKNIDGVITLGAVIKGGTNHDEIVAHNAARKILDLSLEFEKPVSLGISGHGISREKAVERIEEYAKRAVETVIRMVEIKEA